MTVLARVAGDRQAIGTLRRTIAEIDPNVAIYAVGTMGDLVQRSRLPSPRATP
jgi:hypothetical protein